MEHTADLGLEVQAPDLSELFRRGALGAMWLVLEREPVQEGDPVHFPPVLRRLELVEEDFSSLFRSWLRTLLFWEETEGFVSEEIRLAFAPSPSCSSPDGQAFGLTAQVSGLIDEGPRVREIKGVTLHGLRIERRDEGWWGRVIFDV